MRRLNHRERIRECQHELVDGKPLEPPTGLNRPLTIREQIQMALRQELSAQAEANGFGTFDEENDFEDDDGEAVMLSGLEVEEMVPEEMQGLDGDPDPELDQVAAPEGETEHSVT